MYMCYNKLLPASVLNYFCLNNTVHNYQTRIVNNFNIPLVRLAVAQKSIFFQGPKIWNNLPLEIRTSLSYNIFKRRFKQHLIASYETSD